MERKIITVSKKVARFLDVDWDIDWRNQSAGTSNDGSNQIVAAGFPRFVGSPTLRLHGESLAQWRALRDTAQGRIHVYRIPMVDPAGFDLVAAQLATVPMSGGVLFSGGAGFDWDPVILCPNGAAIGAQEIVLDHRHAALPLRPGQILSHADWPFRLTSVIRESSTRTRCGVAPGIRAAIPAGALVNEIGCGLFQMSSQESGRVSYGLNRIATPQLDMIEWINR